MNETPITIVQSDFQTLERLLDTSSNRTLPGIGMLREELNRANIVDSDDISPDCVTMNSTVEFVDDEADKAYEMTLVYPDQAGAPGTVSVLAPVGSALLGLRVGQSIRWQVPGGRQLRLRVVAVTRQPEAARRMKATGNGDKG
ncbi:MAG TPA: nucleoside diphosphate kinase regulator [Woeseiaceae bacterium]|nr:nucleoside diphosphate kinase regulator [Woeseiaceae bacterium]